MTYLPQRSLFNGGTILYWGKIFAKRGKPILTLFKVLEVLSYKMGKAYSKLLNKYKFLQTIRREVSSDQLISYNHGSKTQRGFFYCVIPAHISRKSHVEMLKRCMSSLLHQKISISHIVVVDDASPIPVSTIPPESLTIRIIRLNRKSGPAQARNIGLKIALAEKAEIIAFTDMDCIPSSNRSEAILTKLYTERHREIIMCGRTISYGTTLLDKYHDICGTLNGRRNLNPDTLLYGTTCNMALTHSIAQKVKFDPSFPASACEDIDFCLRARREGAVLIYDSNMVVYHDYGYRNNTLRNILMFALRFFKYGENEPLLISKHPDYRYEVVVSAEIPSDE